MIRLKDLPICIALCFIVLYSAIGNRDNAYWSGAYFVNMYFLIMYISAVYAPTRIKIITCMVCCPALIYVVLKYFFEIETLQYFTAIMFINTLLTLLILKKWDI